MSDLLPVDLRDMLACVDREIGMRRSVYPRWVAAGKMKQSRADREIEVMEALRHYLVNQIAAEKSP